MSTYVNTFILFVGKKEETVGAVVSVVVDAPSSLLLQEMTVRLKRDMRIM